jgi:hypothetical protein
LEIAEGTEPDLTDGKPSAQMLRRYKKEEMNLSYSIVQILSLR